MARYVKKLRIYTISDQDDSGPWMRRSYPDLFYICTPGYAHGGREGYHFATWSGISGDTFHGRFPGANREAFQNDFAARMDWCTMAYEEANHPPVPALAHDQVFETTEGEKVLLKAEGCTDPDGDDLSYRWIYYREAGNSVYWLEVENAYSPEAHFTAPSMGFPQEMHFILAVTDDGKPALTRYKRVIVKVN